MEIGQMKCFAAIVNSWRLACDDGSPMVDDGRPPAAADAAGATLMIGRHNAGEQTGLNWPE